MQTIVIPRRELQWVISRTDLDARIAGFALTEQIQRQLRLVGAWLTDDPEPFRELETQGLLTLVPGDLTLRLRTGASQPGPPAAPWHLDWVGLGDHAIRATGGSGVRVGIIDTGVDDTEPEVVGKVGSWAKCDQSGAHEANPVTRSVDYDAGRHGTQVAGLIVGRTLGVAPAATLSVAALDYPAKNLPVLALFHALTWLRGVDAAGLPRAHLINVSVHCDPSSTNLTDLFFQAASDMIVTAAMGPYATPDVACYPASCPGVVGVGAHKPSGEWAGSAWSFGDPFPSYNSTAIKYLPKPDLHAPGFRVSLTGGGSSVRDGSSFASAITAGAAAVLLSRDSTLIGKNRGDAARRALFAKTRCLRFSTRTTPGAWSPWLVP